MTNISEAAIQAVNNINKMLDFSPFDGHTPGPWEHEKDTSYVNNADGFIAQARSTKDAQLIASAPALLLEVIMTNQTPEQAADYIVNMLKPFGFYDELFELRIKVTAIIQAQREQAVREASQWQPIEEMKKYGPLGTKIIGYRKTGNAYFITSYEPVHGTWRIPGGNSTTVLDSGMPLPAPPEVV